jgi:hypothetical protein
MDYLIAVFREEYLKRGDAGEAVTAACGREPGRASKLIEPAGEPGRYSSARSKCERGLRSGSAICLGGD